MFIKNKKIISIFALALIVVPAVLTFAQVPPPPVIQPPPTAGNAPITRVEEGISLLRQVLIWIATVFWILAVLFILLAAFQYLLAKGDPEKANKAKDSLKYAIYAIAIALLANALPAIVDNFLRARG
jgi:hypothetical protein